MKKKDITSSEEIIEKRYRHFAILLYPEWQNFNNILNDIKGNFKNYAYIKHIPEEKEKKEHIHLILSLDNPRTIESLSKRLEIPKHLIENIKSLRGACRYLIHKDNEDKFQYDLSQVIVSNSFKKTYYKSFDDLESDDEILENIYNYIHSLKDICNNIEIEIELTRFVCQNNYERIFKRYYQTITKYINYVSRET